ncbi:MAG: hypothetical protein V4615_05185 [Bacteroidota bacterium]
MNKEAQEELAIEILYKKAAIISKNKIGYFEKRIIAAMLEYAAATKAQPVSTDTTVYSEEQVKDLLIQQRINCVSAFFGASKKIGIGGISYQQEILNAKEPELKNPVQPAPTETAGGVEKESLRDRFFEEHTHKLQGQLPRVITSPHNLFEWFWNEFASPIELQNPSTERRNES